MRPDVIVVGLGSMGSAAAQQLAERGVRVLGLDRFVPPHGRGAHAGGSRIIRMAYAEGADYVPLLRRAYQLWSVLEEKTGQALRTSTGGLMIGSAEGTIVGGALASARAHGLAYELLDVAEVRRRFPAFTPAETDAALYEEVAGLVRPEAAIAAQLRLARRAGADLRYGVAVHGWRAVTGGGVAVATAAGDLHAERLVIAPGAWAPGLLADIRVPLRVERRVQHYWQPPGMSTRRDGSRSGCGSTRRVWLPTAYRRQSPPAAGRKRRCTTAVSRLIQACPRATPRTLRSRRCGPGSRPACPACPARTGWAGSRACTH